MQAGGRVDAAETGVGGDSELSTVAPLTHIVPYPLTPNLNPYLCRKPKLKEPLPCSLWHPGKSDVGVT